tara:strand:- start:1570 stop:1716 length:147 start_codon:yes stop_codon:yes gene_type:complete
MRFDQRSPSGKEEFEVFNALREEEGSERSVMVLYMHASCATMVTLADV